MIKLNNKNITYVALADSNNSVKGVKEIWYADSNNSVKLVYRRKDALIEGEDYEKYHWLEGRNGAYINTNHKLVTIDDAFEFHAHYDKTLRNELNQEQEVFGFSTGRNTNINNLFVRVYIYSSNGFNGNYFWHEAGSSSWGGADYGVNTDGDAVIKLSADENHYYVSYDDVNVVKTPSLPLTKETYGDIYLFNSNDDILTGHFNGGISYFRITDPTFTTDKLHFIPCKLLKPVPKWLDANGIRRQVGECGMIDLVSGKFYGNVNSAGTFTVENYYERKEWLQGRNGAYIDTKITEVNQNIITFNAIVDGSISNQALFGAEDTTVSPYKRVFVRYNENNSKKLKIYDNNPSREVATDTIVNLVFSDDGNVYLNGDEVTTYSSPLSLTDSVLLFAAFLRNSQGTSLQNSTNMKVSYFSISSKINLIPCTLTMDLPASMDANNIARTKGTSGMWDLVSDRFYGNVANSGTFKAVNLAEGVDYEVHQWLVTELMYGTMMQLPIDSLSFTFKRIIQSIDAGNTYYFKIGQEHYYTDGGKILRIWINGKNTYTLNEDVTFGEPLIIEGSSAYLTFNSVSVPQPSSSIEYIEFGASSLADNINIKTSAITVDGIERYIPVKLLRSIPSKYDANGRARQAGECGMYDTVNDVFYGNVASSGTFSVSDDS